MLTLDIIIFPVQEGHFHFTRGFEQLPASVDQGLLLAHDQVRRERALRMRKEVIDQIFENYFSSKNRIMVCLYTLSSDHEELVPIYSRGGSHREAPCRFVRSKRSGTVLQDLLYAPREYEYKSVIGTGEEYLDG